MRSISKYNIFIIFFAFLIMPVAASAQVNPTETPSAKTEKTNKSTVPLTLKDLSIDFPDVDGWERSVIQKYPTAELGYSINYESVEGGRITIYVYNGGKKNIPSDITDKTVKNEMKNAKSEIQQVSKAGYYQDVKEIKNDTVTLGGTAGKIKALHSLFNFSVRGQNLTSEIYLFSYQNDFIKIRATRSREDDKIENKAVSKLFAELDALFSKPSL